MVLVLLLIGRESGAINQITERSNEKPKQTQITFNTQVKIALLLKNKLVFFFSYFQHVKVQLVAKFKVIVQGPKMETSRGSRACTTGILNKSLSFGGF